MKILIVSIIFWTVLLGLTKSFTTKERILNGNNATATPYAVAVTANGTQGIIFGGGALVTNKHILTIGRLVSGFNNWTIGYGNVYIRNLTNITSSVAALHPLYESSSQPDYFSFYDIGIIFLPVNSLNTNLAAPIALPSTIAIVPQPNEEGQIVGFGAITSNSTEPSLTLREAFLRTTNSTRCQFEFGEFTEASFCATDELYNQTLCYGDQGSGFITRIAGRQVIVGLVTIVDSQCSSHALTGYVRTQYHLNWINAVVGLN